MSNTSAIIKNNAPEGYRILDDHLKLSRNYAFRMCVRELLNKYDEEFNEGRGKANGDQAWELAKKFNVPYGTVINAVQYLHGDAVVKRVTGRIDLFG